MSELNPEPPTVAEPAPAKGVASPDAHEVGHRAERDRGRALRDSDCRLHSFTGFSHADGEGPFLALARPALPISRRRDSAGDLPQSTGAGLGRRHGQHSRAGCGGFPTRNCRSLRSIAHTLAVPCAGFRSRSCSCAHAMAAFTMPTARARRGRRRAGLYEYSNKIEKGELWINGGELPTLGAPLSKLGASAGSAAGRGCSCA